MPVAVEELPDSRQWTTGANLSIESSYQVHIAARPAAYAGSISASVTAIVWLASFRCIISRRCPRSDCSTKWTLPETYGQFVQIVMRLYIRETNLIPSSKSEP